MKSLKIGLVLPGGGARGAYQLGVFLAMEKYNLTSSVKAISGGSIGAFSLLSFLMKDYNKAYKTFKDMTPERVLGYKDEFRSKMPIRGRGLFSRAPLVSYLRQNFNLSKLTCTDIPLFVSVAKVRKRGIKYIYSPEYFQINNLSDEKIINIILASSAIPRVFDIVHYAGNEYVDCLKADNEPFAPILNYDLDCYFVIPLTATHDVRKYYKIDKPIIDFESELLRKSPMINMIDFEPEKIDAYLNCGYFVGLAIIKTLYDQGCFTKNSCPLPEFTNLNSLNIKIIPHRLLTLEEILNEVKKGPKI